MNGLSEALAQGAESGVRLREVKAKEGEYKLLREQHELAIKKEQAAAAKETATALTLRWQQDPNAVNNMINTPVMAAQVKELNKHYPGLISEEGEMLKFNGLPGKEANDNAIAIAKQKLQGQIDSVSDKLTKYGQTDPKTGQPFIDPSTGQPYSRPTDQELGLLQLHKKGPGAIEAVAKIMANSKIPTDQKGDAAMNAIKGVNTGLRAQFGDYSEPTIEPPAAPSGGFAQGLARFGQGVGLGIGNFFAKPAAAAEPAQQGVSPSPAIAPKVPNYRIVR